MKYSFQDLRNAIEIEMQKTINPVVAANIAMSNLKDNPEYYKMQKAKYIKRYRKGNKWVYVYPDDKTVKGSKKVEEKPKEKTEENKGSVLNSLNPTGGIFVDYDPETRSKAPLGKNLTTLDQTMGGSPSDTITVYRGSGAKGNNIVPGDFITTNKQLAEDYAGSGKVVALKVKKGDILDDITEPEGEEYIYRPGAFKELNSSDMQKARPTKYISKKKVKGKWQYTYAETADKKSKKEEPEAKEESNVFEKIMSFFGFGSQKEAFNKIKQDYETLSLDKQGVTWDKWKDHVSEYFANKEKWDNFFSKKSQKSEPTGDKKDKKDSKPKQKTEKKERKINLSIMKALFTLYGGAEKVAVKEVPAEQEDNFDTMPESEEEKTPKEKQIDQRTQEAFETVNEENRAEKEAEAMGEVKELWATSFDEYVKELKIKRNDYIIQTLEKDIQRFKEIIQESKDDNNPYSKKKWAGKRLQSTQNTLKLYIDGSIDDKFKPNPTWDNLEKQYNSINDKNSSEAKSLKRKLNIRINKARKEHERIIQKAIERGERVPGDVLKEYPDLMKEAVKEPAFKDINYTPTEKEEQLTLGAFNENIKIKIKDYTKVQGKDIYLVDEETILKQPRPSYIPELDVDFFAGYNGKNQSFDIARIEGNKYILVDKEYKTNTGDRMNSTFYNKTPEERKAIEKKEIEESKYYLLNAETLAATWDYYQKLYSAQAISGHNEREDKEEESYYKRKREYEEKGRSWPYADFKRTTKRVRKKTPDATTMAYRSGFFVADILGIKGSDGKNLTITDLPSSRNKSTPQKAIIFHSYQSMLKELTFKINDMKVQKQYDEESQTYKKGQETAYGDSNLKDNLLSSHGVKIKRQNGSEIDEQDASKIAFLLDDVYSVFGNRKTIAEKFGLKISYAGDKRMHASKAIGMFIPKYKAIGVSDTSLEGRGFTFAHEFSHFMDAYIGEQVGNHHASDQDGSIENDIAKTFRREMLLNSSVYKGGNVKKGMEDYLNRTCECFARALEQYYAIKMNQGETLQSEFNKDGAYMNNEKFQEKIFPLVENFLEERKELLKAMWKNKTIFIKKV